MRRATRRHAAVAGICAGRVLVRAQGHARRWFSKRRRLAEREGFEPPEPFRVQRFSRPIWTLHNTPDLTSARIFIRNLPVLRWVELGGIRWSLLHFVLQRSEAARRRC